MVLGRRRAAQLRRRELVRGNWRVAGFESGRRRWTRANPVHETGVEMAAPLAFAEAAEQNGANQQHNAEGTNANQNLLFQSQLVCGGRRSHGGWRLRLLLAKAVHRCGWPDRVQCWVIRMDRKAGRQSAAAAADVASAAVPSLLLLLLLLLTAFGLGGGAAGRRNSF